jgi:hypothetical protein
VALDRAGLDSGVDRNGVRLFVFRRHTSLTSKNLLAHK